MGGLLDATLANLHSLISENKILLNFVQGTAWKTIIKNFDKSDGIALPLIGFFDDVEVGNALGSRAGNNSIGNFSVTCPCFPPSFSSKLDSIIITDLFYTEDRKLYGNKVILEKLIKELSNLRNNGKIFEVNGKSYKIYFVFCL